MYSFYLNRNFSGLVQYMQHLIWSPLQAAHGRHLVSETSLSPALNSCSFLALWERPEHFANIMSVTSFMPWKNYFTFHQLIYCLDFKSSSDFFLTRIHKTGGISLPQAHCLILTYFIIKQEPFGEVTGLVKGFITWSSLWSQRIMRNMFTSLSLTNHHILLLCNTALLALFCPYYSI